MKKRICCILLAGLLTMCLSVGCTYAESDTDVGNEEETMLLEDKEEQVLEEDIETEENVEEQKDLTNAETSSGQTENSSSSESSQNNNSSQSSSQNTQSSTPSVTVPEQNETGANLVWVPVNGGKKYHCKSSCSNMKDPMQD